MAQFDLKLPDELIKDFQKIYDNSEEIFGKMTKAGAEVVLRNIKNNLPTTVLNSKMMQCLKITKVFKTPSDDGINTKVGFFGYFENKNGKITPAPLVANVLEYGRSSAKFAKHPFLRRSFKKEQIERAMLEAQKKASGGLLDE